MFPGAGSGERGAGSGERGVGSREQGSLAESTMSRTISFIVLAALVTVAAAFEREGGNSEPSAAASIDSIASPAGPGSAEPNLAVGEDGRVYMSWLEPADSGH